MALDPPVAAAEDSRYRSIGGTLFTSRKIAAVAALALASPLTAEAKPVGDFRYIVAGPGDQTEPSIDGNYVVYAGPAKDAYGNIVPADGIDVLLYDFGTGAIDPQPVAGGPGDQDSPDVFATIIAWRGPTGIRLRNWGGDANLRTATDPREVVSAPSVGAQVAAWELAKGAGGLRDIVVDRFDHRDEYALSVWESQVLSGDRHGPSARGTLVAYIDEFTGASVQLHESDPLLRSTRLLCPGRATGVALGEYKFHTVAAIARAADGHDEDVEVHDLAGELAALRVAGVQQNPHVSADWVAFEDLSTGRSQVVLWQWTTGLVFVPHPSDSWQQLNDLYAGDGRVRVVFADNAAGDFDIALFELTVSPFIPDDGLPTNWPPPPPPPPVIPPAVATCAQTTGVLATLSLGRDGQKPEAGEVEFSTGVGGSMPVLVCIDAVRVSAAWVALDDEAMANPSDFNPDVVHLEVTSVVEHGEGEIAGVIAGKPGATLDVRVIADPDRTAATASPAPALRADPASGPAGSGCGSGGGGGLGCVAALALAFLRRRS